MKDLILTLIAAFTAAILASRDDKAALKAKDEAIADLQEKLRQEDLEDEEIEGLSDDIETALNSALAARPPLPEQITAVEDATKELQAPEPMGAEGAAPPPEHNPPGTEQGPPANETGQENPS